MALGGVDLVRLANTDRPFGDSLGGAYRSCYLRIVWLEAVVVVILEASRICFACTKDYLT